MEFYLARGIQISAMEREQMERLHDMENQRGHCLANWNIQEFFHLPPLRDRFHLPDDPEGQRGYADHIRKQIHENKLLFTETPGLVSEKNPEKTHQYDWNIFHRNGEIVWSYSGGRQRRRLIDSVEG